MQLTRAKKPHAIKDLFLDQDFVDVLEPENRL